MKTQLSNALELAQTKAKYDSYVKQILSNKVILAWILKYTTEEFADCAIEAIISLIEGEPEISAIPIYPGKANQKPEKLSGMSTNIQPNIKLKEEINSMCNLSDLIEERATEQGIKIFVETLKETGQSNEFIINTLVNKFSLNEADAKKYVCNCQKSI